METFKFKIVTFSGETIIETIETINAAQGYCLMGQLHPDYSTIDEVK